MSRHKSGRQPNQRATDRIAFQKDQVPEPHEPPAWPAAAIMTSQAMPADSPSLQSHAPTPSPRTSALDLRTVRFLHAAADLFRRLGGRLRDLAGSTSPVSKGMRRLQGRGRRLHVAETVQLGEKRFVAILRVDGEQFLIGGSATSVSLLANLAPSPTTPTAEPVQVVALTEEPVAAHTSTSNDRPASFSAVLAAHSGHGGPA